jgi:hypothetical protein
MRQIDLRGHIAGRARSIVVLAVATLLMIAPTRGARAENWLDSGSEASGGAMCMDLDSVRLGGDDSVGRSLVTFRVSSCKNGHPDSAIYQMGVKRDECPAVLKRTGPFTYYVFNLVVQHWKAAALTEPAFSGLAFAACRAKGEPDGLVVFENEMTAGTAIVYVDGAERCLLSPQSEAMGTSSDCDVDLRRAESDSQRRHTVRILAGQREVNDTVAISDCHWNWQGTKVFEIMDGKVHFGCM